MAVHYSIVENDGKRTMVLFGAFENGEVSTKALDDSHPNFENIYTIVKEGSAAGRPVDESEIASLIDPASHIHAQMSAISDRVTYFEGNIYFDGDIIVKEITRHIIRMIQSGDENWKNLVQFMENIASNPSKASQRHLYSWLNKRNFTITDDGCFIAYKGVQNDGTSVHAGPGIVNGVQMNGHLPNEVGSVLSIPRSYVDDDRNVGCSTGLHVGTYDYANSFGARLLTVKVNPRDVVSVPTDCDFQKVRVCRYEVLEIAPEREYTDTFRSYYDDDKCEECGEFWDECSCGFVDEDVCEFCDCDPCICDEDEDEACLCGIDHDEIASERDEDNADSASDSCEFCGWSIVSGKCWNRMCENCA